MRAALPSPDSSSPVSRQRQSWWNKFRVAFRGFSVAVQTDPSFTVHIFFATLAIATAAILRCDLLEWALIVFAIGLVFTAELINTAIERLFRLFDHDVRATGYLCLDIAAGGVLVASITSVVIGCLVFAPKLIHCFNSH